MADCFKSSAIEEELALVLSELLTKMKNVEFIDFLPAMAQKLGAQGLMQEFCNGYRLVADPRTGTITLDSLRRNCAALGLHGMDDTDLAEMMKLADLNCDGCVDVREFCVMMVRLNPCLMEDSFLGCCFSREGSLLLQETACSCSSKCKCKPAKPKSNSS